MNLTAKRFMHVPFWIHERNVVKTESMAYTCALYDALQKQIDRYILSYYIGILNIDPTSGRNNLSRAFNYFLIYLRSNLY